MSLAALAETPRRTYIRNMLQIADPFISKEEIINYLSSIYKDPFKI